MHTMRRVQTSWADDGPCGEIDESEIYVFDYKYESIFMELCKNKTWNAGNFTIFVEPKWFRIKLMVSLDMKIIHLTWITDSIFAAQQIVCKHLSNTIMSAIFYETMKSQEDDSSYIDDLYKLSKVQYLKKPTTKHYYIHMIDLMMLTYGV
jgi:hypothetical protein